MITAPEFRERWLQSDYPEPLVVYPNSALANASIPDEAKEFLAIAGLPESAAPFLDFAAPESGTLQSVSTLWKLDPEFDGYLVIGSNDSGDPICIDDSNMGQIVYLNHDHGFQRVLINSSVQQLAESLLAFRRLVEDTQRLRGEDAYLDGDIPEELQQWFRAEAMRIDQEVVQAGCFWKQEIDNLSGDAI